MKARFFIFLSLLLFSNHLWAATTPVRNELDFFTLMRDTVIIDRVIKKDEFESFFSLDLILSSGLKQMIGDISEATRDELSEIEKTLSVAELINQNINTEKYLDLELSVAAPLPSFYLFNYKIIPNLFVNIDLATSLTFTNKGDVTNPMAQVYLKKETKIGTKLVILKDPRLQYGISLYKMGRSDVNSEFSANDISSKGKAIDMGDLDKEQITYSADLSIKKSWDKHSLLFEVREQKIVKSKSQTGLSKFGHAPLLHLQNALLSNPANIQTEILLGSFYRTRYDLFDGLYLGIKANLKNYVPMKIFSSISYNFLTIVPEASFKYFSFRYTLKTPINNPYGNIWVSTLHGIDFNFPFP